MKGCQHLWMNGKCVHCETPYPHPWPVGATMAQAYAIHRRRFNIEGGNLEHDLLRSIGIERVEVLVSVTFADGSSYVERWDEKNGAVGEAKEKA